MVTTMTEEILDGLNDNQRAAAQHINGPAFVMAGPGSGKSHTLVRRTAMLIANGIPAENICLFTFTNKAAGEIKERVTAYIGDQSSKMTMGTYHSVCCRELRKYAKLLGYSNNSFTIMDSDDAIKIAKKCGKEYGLEKEVVVSAVTDYKKKLVLPQQAMAGATNDNERKLSNAYNSYQAELKRQNAMDFDDLIVNMVVLLKNHPDVKQSINNKWKYIMADEAHDNSVVDTELILLLAGDSENVVMISDPDQSIYSFRGSNVQAFINSRYKFNKEVTMYNLAENYRCSQTIVNASKSLIAKNQVLVKEKVVEPARDFKGSPIIVKAFNNPAREAEGVANIIRLLKKRGESYKDIYILYRANFQSRAMEEELLKQKIPYKIIGGVQFFARKEIKDVLSYARMTVNDCDIEAFKRSIAIPKRGIGDKTLEKIDEYSLNDGGQPIPIRQAIKTIKLTGKAGKSLKEYEEFITDLEEKKVTLTTLEFLKYIIAQVGYYDYLDATEKDSEDRILNVQELLNIAKDYDNIEDLILDSSLSINSVEETEDKVQLMTCHASKGLESKNVIIIGCNEGSMPFFKALGSTSAIEEERRLMYVAITRAKNNLFITTTRHVIVNGAFVAATESRFLKEIDGQFIHRM